MEPTYHLTMEKSTQSLLKKYYEFQHYSYFINYNIIFSKNISRFRIILDDIFVHKYNRMTIYYYLVIYLLHIIYRQGIACEHTL